MRLPEKVAVIGGGVIGGGWIARMLENGVDVAVYDPAPDARGKIAAVLDNAERAYSKLTTAPRPPKGALHHAVGIAEAVKAAAFIIESVPERLDIKRKVYREIEKTAAEEAIIASSTSGLLPSNLQEGMSHPRRLIVAHPFNPVYLLPLVEVLGGVGTAPETLERVLPLYRDLGMHPLVVRKEIDAFIADRLLEAVWREALWLISDEVATTAEIDDAIRYGFGLRWAQMGLFETYRIAGGEAGMRHFLAQFGPTLKWPWTKLTDVPELNDGLVDRLTSQSDAQSGHLSIRELERIRDDNLVAILRALKANHWGAGETLARYEKRLLDADSAYRPKQDRGKLLRTLERQVPADWTDYNGHMNESRYMQCFSEATDALLRMIGVDAAYVEAGGSFFTVETHLRHVEEIAALEPIHVDTQVLQAMGKKLHLFHRLYHGDGRLLATGEHMLIHVDLKSRSAAPPAKEVAEKAAAIAAAHAALTWPEDAGRAIAGRN